MSAPCSSHPCTLGVALAGAGASGYYVPHWFAIYYFDHQVRCSLEGSARSPIPFIALSCRTCSTRTSATCDQVRFIYSIYLFLLFPFAVNSSSGQRADLDAVNKNWYMRTRRLHCFLLLSSSLRFRSLCAARWSASSQPLSLLVCAGLTSSRLLRCACSLNSTTRSRATSASWYVAFPLLASNPFLPRRLHGSAAVGYGKVRCAALSPCRAPSVPFPSAQPRGRAHSAIGAAAVLGPRSGAAAGQVSRYGCDAGAA